MCRTRTNLNEISYVMSPKYLARSDAESFLDQNGNKIEVSGNYGTKISAIVRYNTSLIIYFFYFFTNHHVTPILRNHYSTIISILRENKDAKCIVFSQWNEVLDIVAKALLENSISFVQASVRNRLQKTLDSFKKSAGITVLLLPLRIGGNGLNIIEAQHVLLIEPTLNFGAQQQAINRVYRCRAELNSFLSFSK